MVSPSIMLMLLDTPTMLELSPEFPMDMDMVTDTDMVDMPDMVDLVMLDMVDMVITSERGPLILTPKPTPLPKLPMVSPSIMLMLLDTPTMLELSPEFPTDMDMVDTSDMEDMPDMVDMPDTDMDTLVSDTVMESKFVKCSSFALFYKKICNSDIIG